jgi:N-acetylglucosaminyl-diphospho-decaprenol L-rhamnosyltransferase
MEEKLPVSAIVVNYNSGEFLGLCVESLVGEQIAEIIVVDNASRDHSLQSLDHRARVIEPGRNLGYGPAANLGARSASEPYLLICNPDLVVRPGAVSALLARMEKDPGLGVCGPMLRDSNGEVYPSGRDFPGLLDAVGHAFVGLIWGGNPWTRRYRHLGGDQHQPRRADWVSGAFMLVRRLAYESVGGFDESYFMYVEDVDLCWRLRRAGWGVFYEPSAEVDHEQGLSASRHPYRMLLAHHRSLWRFATRAATGRERLALPLVAVGLGARLLLAWADHLSRPVRDQVLATTNVRGRARGELQP